MQREFDFHAFATFCLAAVVIKISYLNWQCVMICGFLLRSATEGSGLRVILNIVERILKISDQKELTMGRSHHICTCGPRVVQPQTV